MKIPKPVKAPSRLSQFTQHRTAMKSAKGQYLTAKGDYLTKKGKYIKDKGWKPVAKAALRNETAKKQAEEVTKREQARYLRDAELAKWNSMMTMNNASAEGTSAGEQGSTANEVTG